MGYGMLSENGKKGGLKNYDTMQFIYKSKDGRIARVGGAYSGPVQPVQRDSEMSCILRGNLGCSQGDYMDLRYAITDKDGEERMITWEHKLKHFFRFEGKSHHAGEYENYFFPLIHLIIWSPAQCVRLHFEELYGSTHHLVKGQY